MAEVRRGLAAALLPLSVAAALAAITVTNVSEWSIAAAASPVAKLGNASISPVSVPSWRTYGGLNVTAYGLCFVPGWEEEYAIGSLSSRVPGLMAHLSREEQRGDASYRVYLGGVLQVSPAQAYGPPVALPATLKWRSVSSGGYWVLTTARFTVGGARARQYINFTATPMSLLSTASYSCAIYSYSDDFSSACAPVRYTFEASIPNNRTYASGGSYVLVDRYEGNPAPSLYTESRASYASLFINYSARPFSAAAGFSLQYFFRAALRDDDYLQVHFFIDLGGDGRPDTEVIYYGSGGGTTPYGMAPVIYRRTLPLVAAPLPGFQDRANVWWTSAIPQVHVTGHVVGVAFTAYSERGVAKVWWDNVHFSSCALPGYASAYTRGGEYTLVYVDSLRSPTAPPSLATEVDAYGRAGNPALDYGVAAAVYDVASALGSVQAAGFHLSVSGLYVRNATDARNNVAYFSVGLDSDGDGVADKEYIYYRYDTVGGLGAIISVFVSRGSVVCTVDSSGSCTPASPAFAVYNLGAMVSGSSYSWSGSIPAPQAGTVLGVAFAAVDASYWAPGASDDFWIYWDSLYATYRVCTPWPAGWLVSGSVYYRPLVEGAAAYAGSFTGDGGFYLFDSSLNPLFGARRSGHAYYARCGAVEVSLGSSAAAHWVDLRPLSGLWEIAVRDSGGNYVFRYGCAPAGAPTYVGFEGVEGFEFRAWGCGE